MACRARRPRLSRRVAGALVALVALAAVVAACSTGDGDDDRDGGSAASTRSTIRSSTTSADAAARLGTLGERGPHGVGSIQLALDDGRRVAAWYPAEAGAGTDEPTETFDIASLLSPALQARIPAELRVQYPIPARPGAAPDPERGPYPVVLFSHGFAGFPEQSADLTTHLASWGFVVAAPDHVERSLSGLLGTARQGVPERTDAQVLAATLDLLARERDRDGSPLQDLADPERMAVTGHSAGAGAAYRLAGADERIDAFIAYSIGSGGPAGDLPDPPSTPGMVMLGSADGVIKPAFSREVFEGLERPRYKVEIADAGHLVFSDICLIGKEKGGLIGIVEEVDLPVPENLRRLASDGCRRPSVEVTDAFPAIDGLSTAFLRTHLDVDDESAALGADVTEAFGGAARFDVTAEP